MLVSQLLVNLLRVLDCLSVLLAGMAFLIVSGVLAYLLLDLLVLSSATLVLLNEPPVRIRGRVDIKLSLCCGFYPRVEFRVGWNVQIEPRDGLSETS